MRRLTALFLCLCVLGQSVLAAEVSNPYGLSILTEEDYQSLLPKDLDLEQIPEPTREELMQYSEQFWRDAVRAIDGETPLEREMPPSISKLRPSFALPLYGTSISLTGRKTFGFKLDSKKYKSDNSDSAYKRSYSNFDFEQEMQIKMEGKIADRIFVDVDYDDQREEEQTIGIHYRGKERELVQSADFGDIDLSLPKTEFISFQKQLFGAKMHLQHKKANLRLIGSRTKGSNKTKQFKGSSVFETVNIADTAYVRRKYYDIKELVPSTDAANYSFLRVPIRQSSEEIYLNDGQQSSSNQYVFYTKTYTELAIAGDTPVTGNFRLLERGVDYSVDYNRNIIVFKISIKEADVIVMDYTNTNGAMLSNQGTPGTLKIIKTEGDLARTTNPAEYAYNHAEMKTVYNTGRQQIQRDDGQGNFSIRVLDANGNAVGPSLTPQQVYPSTITMDFETGTFELLNKFTDDPSLYNNTPVSYKNRSFSVELYSKVKSYYIEPGIVLQSESVRINGALLKRNDDYYIDYGTGFITFYKEGMITQDSIIDVTYDTEGGSQDNSTLLGGRFDFDFTDKIGIGATVLQEGGEKPKSAPTVGSETQSITVYEADFKASEVNLTDKLKVSASGEVAKSIKEKNLYGYAIIDNMDDVKQKVAGSTSLYDWKLGSNPNGIGQYYTALRWDTQEVRSLEINPNAASASNDKQSVLVLNYDFSKGDDEVSLVYPLSSGGVDLSDKNMFELTVLGDGAGAPEINVHWGTVDESSDSRRALGEVWDLPCSQYYGQNVYGIPKTEDVMCRGNISSSEDRGWEFLNPDGTKELYNPFVNNIYNRESQPNGRIDTQDLDGNGRLDDKDMSRGGSFGFAMAAGTGTTNMTDTSTNAVWNNVLDATTWKTYSAELEIDDSLKTRWSNIKHLRITLKKNTKMTGTIKIANVNVAGIAWQSENDQEVVTAKNKADNTDYLPIYDDSNGDGKAVFSDLYGSIDEMRSGQGSDNVFEQALSFKYDTTNILSPRMMAQRNFGSMDMSKHEELRFLIYIKALDPTSEFFVRLGTETNYNEIGVPLDMAGLTPGQWKLISLKMNDLNGDGVPDEITPITPGVTVTEVRDVSNPAKVNFRKISTITAGVQKTSGSGDTGEVWFNELHLAESVKAEGLAYRGDGKVEYTGWGSVSGMYKMVDEDFETPVSVATGQKNTNQEYALNITRIPNLPITAGYAKDTVVTPVGMDNENVNTISYLDEGVVEKERGHARVEYNKPGVPKVSAEYNFATAEYEMLTRKDDSKTYSLAVSHSRPEKVVRSFTAGGSYRTNETTYADDKVYNAASTYFNTNEKVRSVNGRVNFVPWKGASITPAYSLSVTKEDKTGFNTDAQDYNKAMTQTAGVAGNIKIFSWLIPTFNYNITTSENNNLTPTQIVNGPIAEIGDIKSVNRSADGGLGLTLNFRDILPKSKLMRGFTWATTYQLQDADSWQNVESSYDTKSALWVRKDLDPDSGYAYKRNMTLRDSIVSTQKWTPFKEYGLSGSLAPFKTISLTNTFNKTVQSTEELGTPSKSDSVTLPDVVFYMGDIEKFWGGGKMLNAANIKLRYTMISNEVKGSEEKLQTSGRLDLRFLFINRFDTLITASMRNYERTDLKAGSSLEDTYENEYTAQTSFNMGRFRITPKIVYADMEKKQTNGVLTESVNDVTGSLNARMDINLPGGIWIPFVNRNYSTTNRIIWNTTASYQKRRSDVAVAENKNVWGVNTSLDYEISQNLRLTISGGVESVESLYVETDSYLGYNASTVLTIQF
ncbi:cell surface protein SprA [Parelusimicrobium proximum]|uniref:hypothetical protein n=1 Tax=Parelusimicrobium proximum TaxID=3228953 RepID=UPI003D18246A